ncbi:Methyltransferase type 11 [Thiorhodococcus drewsii AZ1]|uniref:Methyltransferase type 11 n=1 Tax=Thiorhodococcus drewsii AZ1 TaxID=765913 RepID=G2E7R0_9GAMM|nr:methyltransferase domain-containing protein [Thiorhodococcus drewsii]EGV27858.1 Methyltransferase type 11 [Thiorhodococcus drewsii AZ1]
MSDDLDRTSASVRHAYTAHYYLEDCGGYETYREHGGKQLDLRLDCMARLAAYRDGQPPLRLLDLGCGRGELARYFAAFGHHVDAIDYSADALRLAEDCFAGEPELRRRVRLECASVTDPQAYRGLYDIVLASDLIEHLAPSELEQLYTLIRRHLAPDGVFILHTFPNLWYYRYDYPWRRRQAALDGEDLPVEPRTPYELQMHINEQSPRVLRRQLRSAFEDVLLWAGDHLEPAGSLARPLGKDGWRSARSLFAIAGRRSIDADRVVEVLKVPAPIAEFGAAAPDSPAQESSAAEVETPVCLDRFARAQTSNPVFLRLLGALRRIAPLRAILDYLNALAKLADIPHSLVALGVSQSERQAAAEARIARLEAAIVAASAPSSAGQGDGISGGSTGGQDLTAWYQDFENHFRGAPSVIRERLQVYLPLLAESPLSSETPLLDLGCGRGDWLALLRDAGYPARGVDTNSAALEQARAEGLTVEQRDVGTCLAGLPPSSLGAISAMHLIEHLPFAQTLSLLDASLRALVPGGLLILETPNPENLSVGACHFYTDPTHLRPLVPAVLEFAAVRCGFVEVRLMRLSPDRPENQVPGDDPLTSRYNAMLHGPRDYALVARKGAS